MKLKKLACLAVAVMMMAVLAVSASAAGEAITVASTTPKAETTLATATDLGAAYAWGLRVADSSGWAIIPAGGYTMDYLIGQNNVVNLANPTWPVDENGAAIPYYMPYVSYKVSADEGYAIDGLTAAVKAHAQAKDNKHQYSIGIYVTASLDVTDDGKVDFSKLTPVVVKGQYGDPSANINNTDLTNKDTALELDFADAVAALGEVSEVYVTVAFNQTWNGMTKADDGTFSGGDITRLRMWTIELNATQKTATVVTPPDDGNEDNNDNTGDDNADTSDAAFLAAVSVALISGAAIVATRKKTH